MNSAALRGSGARRGNNRRRGEPRWASGPLRREASWKSRASLAFFLLVLSALSPSPLPAQDGPALQWDLLYPRIRDRLIPAEEARRRIAELENLMAGEYAGDRAPRGEEKFRFPLKGYTFHSIGGKKGEGYQPQGYDFFDGTRHRGHPGHDIFIRDRNQDGLDDRTGEAVEVIAASAGVVVSVHRDWRPPSPIRGGNYLWIFDPLSARYSYYAHLDRVLAEVGRAVSAGERLGTVGRTGVNAYPKRSPTHLHFSAFHSREGHPKPIDPYPELFRAGRK